MGKRMAKAGMAEILGASEIDDCDPRCPRHGVVAGVSGKRLYVQWIESDRHSWVALDRCHTDSKRRSGYYLPALAQLREEGLWP